MRAVVFSALTLLASAALAQDAAEDRFVDRNRCVIAQILHAIRAPVWRTPNELDRFLTIYPADGGDGYAQCAYYNSGAEVHCEVASPFYQPDTHARLPALARLGYDLDGSKQNYVKEFKVDDAAAPPLADFMLRLLYGAFLDDPLTRLRFTAPMVKRSPSPDACAAVS